MMKSKLKEQASEALKKGDIKILAEVFFNFQLTPTQEEVIKDIIVRKEPRISISAMTRYGKSQLIAIAVGIYLMINRNKKVFFIAPTRDQALILRNYLNDIVLGCPLLLDASDIDLEDRTQRLKKEVSRSRVTFKNGCEYRVFTAHQDGSGLMGFGLGKEGGLVIIDEATKITREAYAKIIRMIGDNPEKSQVVESYNPWDRDNKAYEHSIDETWKHWHVSWRIAVKEGRTTEEFVEQQRKELTQLEFEVLYESRFPEASEDSLLKFSDVQRAIESEFESESWANVERIISCDPADKGLDLTVIMYGIKDKDTGIYILLDIYSEPISDNMNVAEHIFKWYKEKGADTINIDPIGVGAGVLSRVRQLVGSKPNVNACHFGEGVGTQGKDTKPYPHESLQERRSDSAKKRFSNRKAEQYFRLRELFEEGMLSIPKKRELTNELMNMKWDTIKTTGKIKIIDPERSPNFADALCYLTWHVDQEVIFDFGTQKNEVVEANTFTV